MSLIKRVSVSITTVTGGAATGYIETGQNGGRLVGLMYVKDGTVPYADTVTFAITEEDTGNALLTTGAISASTYFAPRAATVTVANAAALYAAAGTAVNDLLPIVGRIKIVLASGGDAKVGKFYAYLV